MKKIIMFALIYSFIHTVYSLDIIIDTVVDVNGTRNDEFSQVFYFNDMLFYCNLGSIQHIVNGNLVFTIPELQEPNMKEMISSYKTIVNIKKLPKVGKLFYYFFDYVGGTFFEGFEINVDKRNVTYRNKTKEEILNSIEQESIEEESRAKYEDGIGNLIQFDSFFDVKTSKKETIFFIENNNNEKIFDFLTAYPTFYFRNFAVNDKVNRISVLYANQKNDKEWNPNNEKNKIVIFSLIYTGTINDTRVRLIRESNLTSETIAYLDAGEKVKVIDRSEKKQKIDDMEAYWLQVETEDKQTGWVYGWFVDVE